jgi:hypothetical protein
MPAKLDKCVEGLQGKMNPRTKKPFTESERFAICNARLKGSSSTDEELAQKYEEAREQCINKLIFSGEAKSVQEAQSIFEGVLAKSGYELDSLESNLHYL